MMTWLQNKDDIPLEKLESTFKQRGDRWDSTPELFRLLALRLKKKRQNLLAVDVLRACTFLF
jgi:hypothetical protein